MKLIVLGDIHLFTLDVHPRRLVSKRLFAHTNLLMNRRHRFNHALLPDLVEHAKSLSPEMVLFSGDVSTSSLEREFEDLMDVVAPLVEAAPEGGVLVPGNHDRYTFKSRRVKRIEKILNQVMPDEFPHVRQLRPGWRLLALDSAIPNRMFSRGALGRDQFDAAVHAIREVPEDEALVVLCHYPCSLPPRVPSAWSHDLREAEALRRELTACRGRVIYIHGHIHKPWHALPSPPPRDGADPAKSSFNYGPAFECLNAGSPCMTSDKYPLGQGFWEIDLPDDPRAPLQTNHHVPMPVQPAEMGTAVNPSPTSASAGSRVRWIDSTSL
ncbi:metallophosphoesterase family protein [Algisphaera agarilytica]|uniref:3',5'-cyclic AMP phosphodiesterase CpdA n=1 Tax=Algisphaera agarilytica TaxID=1385975 RepID=A0A7X0H9V2_9BACT|nr:metallophosphoesterase [Algisphaera agarilytica]MBB6430836.1 3',5'-cyclic AMP phosphodiesterase CpdA [Algisphaera agarilytica]